MWDTVFWMRAMGYSPRPRLGAAPVPAAPALVDGVPVIAYRTNDERLAIDVGGTVRTIVGSARPKASDADVHSGPHGTLLRLTLPRVQVRGAASLAGTLSLEDAILEGAVELPARLLASESGARMESYLAALPGRYALRATFGGPTTQPFLALDAGLDATMTVLPLPSTAKKPAAVRAALAQRPAPAPARPPSRQRERTARACRTAWRTVRDAVRRNSLRRAR